MGEKNNGILEKTSPNSPFSIHHSSLITHYSSLIISSISTSPKFLRSPFFQTAKLLQSIVSAQKEGALADSQHKARFLTLVGNDKRCCHFDRREKSPAPGIIEFPRIIEQIQSILPIKGGARPHAQT